LLDWLVSAGAGIDRAFSRTALAILPVSSRARIQSNQFITLIFPQIPGNTNGKLKRSKGEEMHITRGWKSSSIAILVATLLLAIGDLHAQDVRYNYMPGTDFSKYHTYKWVSIESGAHSNQIVDAEIKQDVDSQLASKGLSKTDSDKADLLVGYQIAVDQEKQWNAYGMGGGLRWGGLASATSSTISVGTLVLDMYDPATKQLVWTGNATKTIDPSSNQEKNQKNLAKAMEKLLKHYPPK
jgi:Domain of unknown function (DUF4136)